MRKISIIFISLLVLLSINIYAEEPVKAFRNFNFGDSPEVIKQKLEQDETIKDNVFIIAGKEYKIGFEYSEDKLYRIKLKKEFSSLVESKEQIDLLNKIISNKYGEGLDVAKKHNIPHKYNETSYNLKLNSILWSLYWSQEKTLTNKIIKIGQESNSNDYKMYVVLYIDDPIVLEQKFKKAKKEYQDKKEKKQEQIKKTSESF